MRSRGPVTQFLPRGNHSSPGTDMDRIDRIIGVSSNGCCKGGIQVNTQVKTYYLRKLVNTIVDGTLTSPSLAEMVHHHLAVEWLRESRAPYRAVYTVCDEQEEFVQLTVTDARGYSDPVYERGLALLKIGVNGALVSLEDESYAARTFAGQPFRTCPHCRQPFAHWLDYYGHVKTTHWGLQKIS